MSSERKNLTVWTCDVCEHVETVDDSGSGYPTGWFQVAAAPVTAKLGNTSAKHLCSDCRDNLVRLMENVLGDVGDLAQAWDEGFKQGGPMHDVNYDDPDAHTRNPYRKEVD